VTSGESWVVGDPDDVVSGFDQTPVLQAFYEGRSLIMRAANRGIRDFLPGRGPLIGHPLTDAAAELLPQGMVAQMQRVQVTGEVFSAPEWRVQLSMADGGAREIFINMLLAPWRHDDGSVRGVIATALDVTALVRAREAAEAHTSRMAERYARAAGTVTALQEALLPADLPVLPRVRLAARYVPAERENAAGGDWFDAVPLPGGRVALVVGDVVGHGVAASATMGQLRTVVRERLLSGAGVADVLAAADRYANSIRGGRAATVCVVVLDPESGHVAHAAAGHPAPLVLAADGTTRFLNTGAGGPLGTATPPTAHETRLADGETLVLYSDGIIERPGISPAQGVRELVTAVRDTAGNRVFPMDAPSEPVERVCRQTLELLTRNTGHTDDITLLVAQRGEAPHDLSLVLPATGDSVRTVRFELGQWLVGLRASTDDETSLQHAVGELVTNAVEHAYVGRTPLDVALHARLSADGHVEAVVRDRGRWLDPHDAPFRGNGLGMAGALADHVSVERGDTGDRGTTATLRHRLRRPVRVEPVPVGDPSDAERPAHASFTVETRADGHKRVIVVGPLDAEGAENLDARLRHATRGGTVPVTVDLSRVNHLSSAGVQVLHRVSALCERQDTSLTLHTTNGGVAHHVLSLVHLPHVTFDP